MIAISQKEILAQPEGKTFFFEKNVQSEIKDDTKKLQVNLQSTVDSKLAIEKGHNRKLTSKDKQQCTTASAIYSRDKFI